MGRDAPRPMAGAPSALTESWNGGGSSTLVIGLGNPMLGDDGVGWRIAEEVERRLRPPSPSPTSSASHEAHRDVIEVDCVALGGLSLMERMIGYRRVILADAVITGRHAVGQVLSLRLADLLTGVSGHSGSTHDVSLATALEIGRTMGARIPEDLLIVGVETSPNFDFSEDLSEPVAAALPLAVETVLQALTDPMTGPSVVLTHMGAKGP